MVIARHLKFRLCIPHEKIADRIFMSELCPFSELYVPLKTKIENPVCKISQKVFELEHSYLVYWLGLSSI